MSETTARAVDGTPRAAPAGRRIAAQGSFEMRAVLRNGEQVMVTVLLPLILLVGLARATFVSLDTGEIHYMSELDLGAELALSFTAAELPDCHDRVADFFRRKGAYGRFKALLESKRVLERWYAYESDATEKVLRQWCAENDIRPIDKKPQPG